MGIEALPGIQHWRILSFKNEIQGILESNFSVVETQAILHGS
jgi:hypothetical protein